MKLISCYIEGYGKLKGKEYTFSDGLTTVFAENGEGKSTLASFLKAMFYGLKGYKKNSKEFCDREHFYPFDGGRFGGNLTLEKEGKRYKIERFFGEKSETVDTLKVYVDGAETEEFGEDIGRAVFGVDEDSFLRTAFLDGSDLEISSTSGIHAKLSSFLEGGDENEDLDRAKAALEKAAKVYKKSRLGQDKISEETGKIVKLNERIDNAAAMQRALEEKYGRFYGLQEEIETLNAQIVVAQRENELRSQFEHYDSLEAGVKRSETALASVLARYPQGLPSQEDTLALNAYLDRANAIEIQLASGEFSQKDREKLQTLSRQFSTGVPTESELLQTDMQIQTLSERTSRRALLQTGTLNEREQRLQKTFAGGLPTPAQRQKAEEAAIGYTALQEELKSTAYADGKTSPSLKTKGYLFVALLSLLLCLVGGLCLAANAALGGALLAFGGVTLLADGFAYLNKKSSGTLLENPKRAQLQERLRQKEDTLKALLLPYGYASGNGVLYDFAMLQADCQAYEGLLRAQAQGVEEEGRLRRETAALTSALTSFFARYRLTGEDFFKLSTELKLAAKEYSDLQERERLAATGRFDLEKELFDLQEKRTAYERKYGLTACSPNEILEDIRAAARLSKEIAEGKALAENYKAQKGLSAPVEGEREDLTVLQALLSDKQSERSKVEREIAADEREVEQLDGYEQEKRLCEERLATYKKKYKLLTAAADFLERAEGALLDKYVRPVREEFLRYAERIESSLGEKFTMTKDFAIRFERGGAERSEKHLSSGQLSVCALCFRLALMKTMYEGRLPFLLLDDPFTGLDAKHLERVREVLRELSKDTQMLYFTCHESRNM